MTSAHQSLVCQADPRSAAQARTWVRERVREIAPRLPAARVDDAVLIASELVTSALRGGAGELRVRVSHDAYAVRIDVIDEHADVTEHPETDPDGHDALDIVEAFADDWGWHADGGGRRVVRALLLTTPNAGAALAG